MNLRAEKEDLKDLLNETQGCLEETEKHIQIFEIKIKEWTELLHDLKIKKERLKQRIKEIQKSINYME